MRKNVATIRQNDHQSSGIFNAKRQKKKLLKTTFADITRRRIDYLTQWTGSTVSAAF